MFENIGSENEAAEYPDTHLGYPAGFLANRTRQAVWVDKMMQRTGFEEILATEASRVEYIDSLDPDEFMDILLDLNGLLVNIPSAKRKFARNIQNTAHNLTLEWVHPASEDKEQLLKDVLKGAQSLPTLEEKALLIAVGITAIHPFGEGNGRTARLVYHVLANGYRPSDPILHALLGEHGHDISAPDPSLVIKPLMGELELNKYRSHLLDPETHEAIPKVAALSGRAFPNGMIVGDLLNPLKKLEDTDLTLLLAVFNEPHLRYIVPYLAAQQSPRFKKHLYPHPYRLGHQMFDFESFSQNINQSDINRVRELYRTIKTDYVHILIDAFKNTDKHKTLMPLPDGDITQATVPQVLFLYANRIVDFNYLLNR